nr:hypothetical protein [Tanacetum cinerariifolium]
MSAMANTTLIVTTVTKHATNPRDADATSRLTSRTSVKNIMRTSYQSLWTRLDFRESSKKRRIREDSHHSSARALTTRPERLKVRDRLRYGDRHVLDRLGHRRQSAFDRLSETYLQSTTKSRPGRTNFKDRPHGRNRPRRLDASNEGGPEDRNSSVALASRMMTLTLAPITTGTAPAT